MKLTIDDLQEVRGLLFPIRTRWYDIGVELKVDIESLENIKCQYDDRGDCLREMIKVWLKSLTPTWKLLAQVLESKVINDKDLAKEALKKSVKSSGGNKGAGKAVSKAAPRPTATAAPEKKGVKKEVAKTTKPAATSKPPVTSGKATPKAVGKKDVKKEVERKEHTTATKQPPTTKKSTVGGNQKKTKQK